LDSPKGALTKVIASNLKAMLPRTLRGILLVSLSGVAAWAQSTTPILSGGLGFFSSTIGGVNALQPVAAPVLVVPLGSRWLIESRADFREFIQRVNGTTGPYNNTGFITLEYFQVDYIANSHLTVTAGRFLTPFDIFNERLSAIWINKFQDAPLIAPIGIGTGDSDGFMVRGNLISGANYEINYTAYFSTFSSIYKLDSTRAAGGRAGVFFPGARLEIGGSYQRYLQNVHMNCEGAYLSWGPSRVPLNIKGEFAHSTSGQGYWIQAAYRLSQFGGEDSVVGRLEPVFRMQQFHRSHGIAEDFVPNTSLQRPDFALNYYFPYEIRLNGGYSRQFSPLGDANVWEAGITYRFLLPLRPGGAQ
jgi:hypothetical protein